MMKEVQTMPNEDMKEDKQGPLYLKHKTQRITIMSYLLATGEWVPKAWVNPVSESDHPGKRVVDAVDQPLPTREAADAVAKKLAIEWIDTQFPSATD
jgi:hypothetical protein